jgi:uncharacterized protein YdcH (DUF465 family)
MSHPDLSMSGTWKQQSKDIDLFVPDPQYLGDINPRLSDLAESLSTSYEENAEFIKLFLPHGEIDKAIAHAAPFMQRHGSASLQQIDQRSKRLQGDFEDIAAIDFTRSFAECMKRAHDILEPIITKR